MWDLSCYLDVTYLAVYQLGNTRLMHALGHEAESSSTWLQVKEKSIDNVGIPFTSATFLNFAIVLFILEVYPFTYILLISIS